MPYTDKPDYKGAARAALTNERVKELPEDYEDLTPEQKASLPKADVAAGEDAERKGRYRVGDSGEMYEKGGTRFDVAASPHGGETPEEAAQSWKSQRDNLSEEKWGMMRGEVDPWVEKYRAYLGYDIAGLDAYKTMERAASGKIIINDPKLQAEAVDIANRFGTLAGGKPGIYWKGSQAEDVLQEGQEGLERTSVGDLYKHKTKEQAE